MHALRSSYFGVITEHPIKQWDTYEYASELIGLFLGSVLHCFGSIIFPSFLSYSGCSIPLVFARSLYHSQKQHLKSPLLTHQEMV